jgi:hypothetical protein
MSPFSALDPDLATVVDAWSKLPEAIRAGIVCMGQSLPTIELIGRLTPFLEKVALRDCMDRAMVNRSLL